MIIILDSYRMRPKLLEQGEFENNFYIIKSQFILFLINCFKKNICYNLIKVLNKIYKKN